MLENVDDSQPIPALLPSGSVEQTFGSRKLAYEKSGMTPWEIFAAATVHEAVLGKKYLAREFLSCVTGNVGE